MRETVGVLVAGTVPARSVTDHAKFEPADSSASAMRCCEAGAMALDPEPDDSSVTWALASTSTTVLASSPDRTIAKPSHSGPLGGPEIAQARR